MRATIIPSQLYCYPGHVTHESSVPPYEEYWAPSFPNISLLALFPSVFL